MRSPDEHFKYDDDYYFGEYLSQDIFNQEEIIFELNQSNTFEYNSLNPNNSFLESKRQIISGKDNGFQSCVEPNTNLKKIEENKDSFTRKEHPTNTKKEKKKIQFISSLQKKRGRDPNPNKKGKKPHTKYSSDNIFKTLIVHFLRFLIDLANDAKFSEENNAQNNDSFKQIDYGFKCTIIIKNSNQILFNKKYENVFEFTISKKSKGMKGKNKTETTLTNKTIYDKSCKTSPLLKMFFQQKVSEVFKNYYCRNKKDNNNMFDFDGFKIKLSDETKTIYKLFDEKGDIKFKEKLIRKVKNYFKENLL